MIAFRAVMEVLGKPKEHIEQALKEYIQQLKQDERYKITYEEFAETKPQENSELWVTFAELEIQVKSIPDITSFCLDYMPSVIEILEPAEVKLSENQMTNFFNDLQAKLHQVDMVAKQVKMENDILKKSTGSLLRNYVQVLLSQRNLTSPQLSGLTGVEQDKLEDFLDKLIDEGLVDMKEGIYFLKKK
ncbi:MAG: hypothetical protein AABX13_00635 [Nanoarchaeota archaeon]